MEKIIKIICIAGILALLVLFVFFTGNGRSSTKRDFNDNSFKQQTIKPTKKDNKKIETNTQAESDFLDMVIPW